MSPNGNIQATIEGDVRGQVAVGNYILQVGDINGGVVNVAPPSVEPRYSKRKSPVRLRPRPFPSLLDRDNETATVKSALQVSAPVSLYGPPGIGKTSLLRSLAHKPETSNFPDGVVYLHVSGYGLDDVLQYLFDAFHESSTNFKPTDAEIRIALRGIRALVLLDDLALSRDEVTVILDAAPACSFVLAGVDRALWGEGQILSLEGLPVDDAVDLFVLELNRSLDEQEQAEVGEICALLKGHPLRVFQSASVVREKGNSISDVKNQLIRNAPENVLVQASLEESTDEQKSMVAILAAAGGVAVPISHLEKLAQSTNAKTDLQGLVSLGVVKANGSKFSLAGDLATSISNLWDLTSWEDRLIEFLVDWIIKKPAQDLLDDSVDVLVQSIQKAGDKKRWSAVVQIGRGLERTLALWRRWQTWMDILNLVLKAARALGDRKVEAWALHQLGTRAACLGLGESARGLLSQALQIRQAIGDQTGLAITQNNMHVFFKIPLPPKTGQSGCRRWLTCGAAGAGGVGFFVVVATALILLWPDTTPPEPQPTVVIEVPVSATPVPATETDVSTITPPSTITPTLTPTPMPYIEIQLEELTSIESAVLYQGPKQDFYRVPVNVLFSNQGNIDVEDLVAAFFYESTQGPRQIEFSPSGKDEYVGDVDISLISSGSFENLNGYVMLPKTLGGNSVNLFASLDRCEDDLDCEIISDRVALPQIIYDFVDESDTAKWIGYDPNIDKEYDLNFNGPSLDPTWGSVGLASNQVLEDGSRPFFVLSSHPTWVSEGEVEGLYINFIEEPSLFINAGDRLVTRVGFVGGGGGDGVNFRVRCFSPDMDDSTVLLSKSDTNNGRLVDSVYEFSQSEVCGLIDFKVTAGPSSNQDWAVWVAAYIERP